MAPRGKKTEKQEPEFNELYDSNRFLILPSTILFFIAMISQNIVTL